MEKIFIADVSKKAGRGMSLALAWPTNLTRPQEERRGQRAREESLTKET